MQTTSIVCDRCCHPVQSPHLSLQFAIVIGKEADPSGNGYQDTVLIKDLCDSCIGKLVQWAFDKDYFQ